MVDNQDLISNLDKIQSNIFKNYLFNMQEEYSVVDFNNYNSFVNSNNKSLSKISYFSNIQAIKIERWVYDKKEEIIDRFRNIYSTFANGKDSLALVIKRTIKGTEFYFVLKNDALNNGNEMSTSNSVCLLRDSIKGNFPGTTIRNESMLKEGEIDEDFFGIGSEDNKSISILTNVTSEKSEKHISQGIEKLLNGIIPKRKSEEYTIVFLAEPINHKELLTIKNGYQELASSIFSYAEFQKNQGETHAKSEGESDSNSHTEGTNESLAKINGFNIGTNVGVNIGNSTGKGWLSGLTNVLKATTRNIGTSVGVSAGYQHSRTITEGSSKSDTDTHSTNFCVTNGDMSSVTNSYRSYPIYSIVKRIEKQLERIESCESVGMWRQATYVVAENSVTSKNVANYLLGLMQGNESFVETAIVNSWHYSIDNSDFTNIKKFVQYFSHPIFVNNCDIKATVNKQDIGFSDIECITPTTYISSMELAQIMTFPYKSIQGLSSIECAEFERNVLHKNVATILSKDNNRKISFGSISHMHEVEENNYVDLDIDSLTKHTFITGSTGSGKSTAIYKILHELREKEIPFLVIEPAKGEYRLEFEKYARVYSTNVNFGTLLQINPFKFNSEGILVNEHIDRLVEIFNVCWPMYAAMPAVLKEAIEKSYVAAGWDLSTSTNSINEALFPCFSDVLKQLYNVINQSDFSQEVKSNYIGSLVTRVKSLTNGILGQVFSNGDMGDEKLFSDYTIIDLSRIGSIETKAMIMGILVMRMQEYHMTYSSPTNELRHITVLEEAHNLLKRTSTEQSSESSNLLGKSVEMIANAIAEMRTYGEGFIIADQSPGLMDMSVIRNTNTKIILSLPDYSDRELVGKSVGLNDEQIVELAKLGQGVAAVYQNKWIAPVLCAIKKYEIDKDKSEVIKTNKTDLSKIIFDNKVLKAKFADTILNDKIDELDNLRIDILDYPMHVDIKLLLLEHLYSNNKFSRQEKISVIYDLYFTEKIKGVFEETELSLKLSDNINLEMKEYLYSKWVNALDIPNGILDNELLGIINIILYKMKVDNITQTEQCERFLSNIYTGRGY